MSSINTNASAMNALSTLRMINSSLTDTQGRVSSGLKVQSAKDNAAYFSISETMRSDSGMYRAIDESLTLTKNSVSTGRLGAETVVGLAQQFVDRLAFAQQEGVDREKVQAELDGLVAQIDTTIKQSSFNGQSMVDSTTAVTVVTGVTRDGGTFATSTMTITPVDLTAIHTALDGIAIANGDDAATMAAALTAAEAQLANAIEGATSLGVAENSIETQQEFLSSLSDRLDSGIGAMVDADMEEEAARLQSLQVQQQLATQSLSIANQAPQNILSLFR
ncbi:flagellar protein [Jannaschia sp. Os4]|uniref:flagellin N-terminal helical domain-containing protein n=1 Tax=Jannaschia sp. Os4 TaxID=2807617 RepID=UPI00193A4B3A|nr:flagellin [Jannaschia sp. Os4]MBM2575676.1 flagellar protein [Jannaschia sp. Os4]